MEKDLILLFGIFIFAVYGFSVLVFMYYAMRVYYVTNSIYPPSKNVFL